MKEERISRVQEHRIELLRRHFSECFNKDGSLDIHKMLELLEGLTQDTSGGGGEG